MTLAAEILSQLPLANKAAAWGTLGTVKPHPSFDVDLDVEDLVEAMAGKEVHKEVIVDIITGRSNAQRQQIVSLFRKLVNEDLSRVLEGTLSGHLKGVILGLLQPPAQYDAHQLKSAMKLRKLRCYQSGLEWNAVVTSWGTFEDQIGGVSLDLSTTVQKECRKLEPEKRMLRSKNVKYAMMFPTKLKIIYTGRSHFFLDAEEATQFIELNITKWNGIDDGNKGDGLGTDEDLLLEILSTRSNEQLREIRTVYKDDFKMDLENDISKETSGDFKELLFALAKGVREKSSGVIAYIQIDQDARALSDFTKNSNRISAQWISILTVRDCDHLLRVFQQYRRLNSSEVEEAVRKHFKGDFQKALLSLASVIRNTPLYFADKLYKSMKGLGTKEDAVNRILISRSETDLLSIRTEFRKTYGKSLYSSLQSETKGEYQTALLALCRAEDL